MTLARPAPYTWTVGDIATAALLNGIRDGLTWSQNPPAFCGSQATVQSIANSTWVAISLDSNILDSYSGHSTTTNNSRWTCPSGAAGWYLAGGVAVATQNGTGNRGARLQVNGNPVPGAASFVPAAASTNGTGIATPVRPVYLNVGDYVEIALWQNSGGALNTAVFSDLTSSLSLVFIHA